MWKILNSPFVILAIVIIAVRSNLNKNRIITEKNKIIKELYEKINKKSISKTDLKDSIEKKEL